MPFHLAGDLLLVTPRDQRIEGSVAARRRELILWPAQAHEVLAIVLQRQVGAHIDVARNASRLAIFGEDDRLLGSEDSFWPQNAARLESVLDRHAVGMSPGRPLAGH